MTDLHRFRPSQRAVGADRKTSRPHYYWLAWEWANLYLACSACTAAQGALFPTAEERAEVESVGEALTSESALLIDPCRDNPEQHFVYTPDGEVVSASEQGRTTIEVFALNRPDLIKRRRSAWSFARQRLDELDAASRRGQSDAIVAVVHELYSSDGEFPALRRQVVNQRVQWRPSRIDMAFRLASAVPLADVVGSLRQVTNAQIRDTRAAFHGLEIRPDARRRRFPQVLGDLGVRAPVVRSVEIENFRGIRQLRLEFPAEAGAASWCLLLGENGTGKTTVLQAIATAMAPQGLRELSDAQLRDLLPDGKGRATVTLTFGDGREQQIAIDRDGIHSREGFVHPTLIAAYGATRLPRRGRQSRTTPTQVVNLFVRRSDCPILGNGCANSISSNSTKSREGSEISLIYVKTTS